MCKHTSTIKCNVDDYLCINCGKHVRYLIHKVRGINLVMVEEVK